jgi:hypothetical protein
MPAIIDTKKTVIKKEIKGTAHELVLVLNNTSPFNPPG